MRKINSIPIKRITPGKSIEYNYQKAKRKNVAIKISEFGEIIVLAPSCISFAEADRIVDSKHQWISHQKCRVSLYKHIDAFSSAEKRNVSKLIRQRAEHYLELYTGKKPKKIFIRYSSSRWGSCSSLGNISLNGYLISVPDEYFEYVLIHELTHLYHLNHSADFWEMMSSRIINWKHLRKELAQYKLPPTRPSSNH